MPMGMARAVGRFLGWVAGSAVRYRRVEVLEALARSLPETTPDRRRQIASHMYRNLGLNVVENLRLAYGSADDLLDAAEADDFEILRGVLAAGRGALILTGHIGNWELAGFSLRRHGFPVSVVTREMKGAALEAYVTRMRERYDIHLIPRQNAYRACRKALQDNRVVVFMLDQNMIRTQGVFVDFFGRPACTTPGLAHLSAAAGTPVVPAFCFRTADGVIRMKVRPPLDPPRGRDKETIREATARYTHILEEVIRGHPDQWIWIHRRWRTQAPAYGGEDRPAGFETAAAPRDLE